MIRQKTVLVLGAGASAPYGFPLGTDLVDQICAEILGPAFGKVPARLESQIDPRLAQRLVALGHTVGEIQNFATALRGFRPYSIDTFLEMRPQFLAIGKATIADVLLRAEGVAKVTDADAEVDWYRYLCNKVLLRTDIKHFEDQAKLLRIVTFNFDRSFEYALLNGVQHGFGIEPRAARKLVLKLRIHHVHGRLGKPVWYYPGSSEATEYGARTDDELHHATRKAVRSLRVVHEDGRESDLAKAREALADAAAVYFIGFGFDERNLSKLEIPKRLQLDCVVKGTVLGWSTAEQGPLARHFGKRPGLPFRNIDARGFLREYADELFA